MRLYFLPTLSKYRLLLGIGVFLIWLAFFFILCTWTQHSIGAHLCRESRHIWDGGISCYSCFLRCLRYRWSLNAHLHLSAFCCQAGVASARCQDAFQHDVSGCRARLSRIPVWLQSQECLDFHCWGRWGQRKPPSAGAQQCKSMQWVVPTHLHWSTPQD